MIWQEIFIRIIIGWLTMGAGAWLFILGIHITREIFK